MLTLHLFQCARTALEIVSHAHHNQNVHNVHQATSYTMANAQQHAHQQNISTASIIHVQTVNKIV